MIPRKANTVSYNRMVKRIRSAGLAQRLRDKRKRATVHNFEGLVHALELGMASGCLSLREVEQLTAQLDPRLRKSTAIGRRISDTVLGRQVNDLEHQPVREALHAMVKAELQRKTLEPIGLPFHWIAIDGKGLGMLRGKANFAHPDIQVCKSDQADAYGLARAHRGVLISACANFAVDQRPIPGDTNEIGALPQMLRELFEAYKYTDLVAGIIADAGNCSVAVAEQIHERNVAYALRITGNQGEIYLEAERVLAHLGRKRAERVLLDYTDGGVRHEYRLYRYNLGEHGYLSWRHARQLVRIEHIVYDAHGEIERCGDRYWVSNVPWETMKPGHWLELARRYWGVENGANWTADVFFNEDARRTPWTTKAEALYAVSTLRMLVMSILALLRSGLVAAGGGRLGWKVLLRQVWSMLCPVALPRRLEALA